jgi:predicted transcriptional regulator
MLLPSEIEAKSLIPAVRAILAKKLIGEYSLKEEDVAKDLGITQAAVSNYVRGTRGDIELISKLESVREVMRMIDDIAKDLSTNKAYTPTFTTALSQISMSRSANSAEVRWFVNTSLSIILPKS